MKGICLLLLIASSSASAAECLSYGEVSLEGALSIETFPGTPNQRSVERGDKPETYFFVSPPEPFCVGGTKHEAPAENISKVPIAINRKGGWPIMKSLVGAQVSCRGKLLPSNTGYHHSPVLLRGMCYAAQSGAPADGSRPAGSVRR